MAKPWTYKPCVTCSGGATSKARSIERWLKSFDKHGRSGGIYNCRRKRGRKSLSVHACGRAIDWYPSSREMGDLLFAVITGYPEGGDIQQVIWRNREWGGADGPVVEHYAKRDHMDHLHIETRSAA